MTPFGRLDILFPDGQRESHQLSGGAITVGSADSCSIQLADPSVADRHFRLDASDDGVTITNLAAGAFVDGQRIPAYTPVPLGDTADIMIGPLRLTFYRRSNSPTISMPAFNEQTQPALIGFRAHLENAPAAVFPASNVTLPLSITNTSNSDAEFLVELSGLPDDWVKPDRVTFPLPAGEETQLLFLVKPERRSDIPPQHFALDVNITRLNEGQERLRLVGIIELGGFGGLSLAIDPPVCQDNGGFNLYLLNQGNEPLTLALRCEDPESRLDLRLNQTFLTLPPGGRAQVPGGVRSRRRPLVGQTRQLPFVLIAQAENPTGYRAPLPASVRVTPLLSRRLASLLIVLIFAAVALAVSLLFQPPEPVIMALSLSQAQVAQGTPVELSWSAEHAGRYVIEVDRVAVAELPADASSYSLDTRPYTDPVDIALIAQQGDATVIASRRLDIYEPVNIVQFYADRASMLRNVFATLTVRWVVEGALSLDISRPPGFETASESRASNAHGEFALRGAPAADFEILLSAVDEIGNITQHALQIAIRDPECSPRRDVLLYAGPDARHNQVKVAVEYVPVLARGTNQNRDWLQVELASGHTGWGAYSSFLCQGFAPSNLEIITDIPALPTATPTSTPTATSSPTPSPTATVTFTPIATAAEP